MKLYFRTQHTRFILGILFLSALALFLIPATNQTSASSNHLAMSQTDEYCAPFENGGFENGIMPWITSGQFEITAGRTGQGLAIITPYARQKIDAEPNKDFTISLYAKTEGEFGSNWTGIGVDYLDGVTELADTVTQITEPIGDYTLIEISGTTPANTSAIRLWLYSGNGVTLFVDDIEIEWIDCSTTPPPPIPTQTPEPTAVPTATPVPPTPVPTPTPERPENLESIMIFDDAVSSDWYLGSWGVVSLNPLAKEPIFEGENSLEVSLANGSGTAFFEAKSPIPAPSLYSVNFMVSGVDAPTQTFEVQLMNKSFQPLSRSTVTVTAGEWSEINVTYSSLPADQTIQYIAITNSVSSAPFYLDNVFIGQNMDAIEGPELLDTQIFLPAIIR